MEDSSPNIGIFQHKPEESGKVLSTRHRGWTAPQQVGHACADFPWVMSSALFLLWEKMIRQAVECVHHADQLHRRNPFFYRYNFKSKIPIGDKR